MDRLTETFLDSLEDQKALSRKKLEKIAAAARETKRPIAVLLEESGVPKSAILKAKSEAFGGVPPVDLTTFIPEPELVKLIPKAMALRHNLLCIGKKDGKLVVAMSDPGDVFAVEYVAMRTGCELIPRVALEKDLQRAIETFYGKEENRPPQSPSAKSRTVGSGGKEAVEESSLQEIRKRPPIPLSVEPSQTDSARGRTAPTAAADAVKSPATLLKLVRELSSTLEIDKLLLKIIEAALQLCGAEESSILLYDENLNVLYFKCASGPDGEALKQVILPVTEESIAGWVALHRDTLLVEDTSKEKRHYKGIDQLLNFKTRNVLCVPILVGGKLYGVLEAINKQSGAFTAEDRQQLEFLAGHSGVCLANAALVDELHDYFIQSLEILIGAVEAQHPSFKGHSTEVARLSSAIARDLGIGGKTYEIISYAALLHDVGKLRLPPGAGGDMEKQHPALGAEMLKDVKMLREAIPFIRMHHERFDGSGYPDGLSGDALPLAARILSLAEDYAEWGEESRWSKPADAFIQDRGSRHDPRVLGSFQKVAQSLPARRGNDEPAG